MTEKDKSLQERMRQDDKTAMDYIYRKYKEGFINYALRFELNRTDLEDIYQDSIIALYQNFAVRNLTLDTSSIKTYLYGIGKNMIYNRLKNKNRPIEIIDDLTGDHSYQKIEEVTMEQRLLAKHFKNLGASCQNILKLFYYQGFTISEIVEKTDYKDQNTVKSHKSRCLKSLREKIAQDQ